MDARDAFLERAKDGGIIPVMREVITDADTPVAAFTRAERAEAWRYRGKRVDRWTPAAGWEHTGETDDPITHLADRMRALPSLAIPGLPRFTGGAVGYLGYDLVRSIERLPNAPPDTLDVPDAIVMIADS